MNRHASMTQSFEKPWDHEYKGGRVFFGGKGFDPISTGSDLFYAAAVLTKLSGDKEPLVWGKRLAHRYVEARNPKTGIGPGLFSEKFSPDMALFPYRNFSNPTLWQNERYYYMRTPEAVISPITRVCLCQFLLDEILKSEDKDFTRWAHEELTAIGKMCYSNQDTAYVPIFEDGTSREGYLCTNDGVWGFKGTKLAAIPARPYDFWAYAVAYGMTDDSFMWEIARSIAAGNKYGDIGVGPTEKSRLTYDSTLPEPYGLLGFLELYRKTGNQAFLRMAERIADTMLADRFHNGFFVGSAQHVFCKFDAIDPLVLLHLHTVAGGQTKTKIHQVWPGTSFFDMAYRNKEEVIDNLIYTQTEFPLPMSLQEAAAIGDLELIKSLVEKGDDVNGREDTFFKTPLHRAAISGHKDVVEFLLVKGADINARAGAGGVVSALHYAVENGHTQMTELLVSKGAEVNAKNGRGDTPLHFAASSREAGKDIVDLLISNGADVNARNDEGQTPLDIASSRNRKEIVQLLLAKGATISSIHIAAQMGDLARAKALLEQGADVNAQDDKGVTALHYAVQEGHGEVAEFLITKDADVNGKDKYGYTPLYYAIWYENKDIIKLLVTKGADVNLKPEKDYPPLHYAVWNGDIDMAELFVAHGAKFDLKDQDGWTAFRYAAWEGNRELVKFFVVKGANVSTFHGAACVGDLELVKSFVEKGANVNAKDELGWTPLFWAASTGQIEVAEFLIVRGADIQAETNDGTTVIHKAAQSGEAKLVELLISKGTDVNAKAKNGNTPLYSAASAGHRVIVELLIAEGANVDEKGIYGQTPLYRAARQGHGDVVEVLIDKGADIDAKARLDRTALNMAAIMGRKEIAALLIAKSADVNSKDTNGQTPLHSSVRQGSRDIAEMLILNGADANAKNKWNRTPLDLATDRGHTEIVKLLRKHAADLATTTIGPKSVRLSLDSAGGMDEICDLIFDSPATGKQYYGYPVVCGDVNGDGCDDLLTTASQWNKTQGRAYLYYGGMNMDAIPDKIFTGEAAGDLFGDGGAALDDINGDNYDDVLVGAPGYSRGARDGRVYIFYGGPDMDDNADLILEGEPDKAGYFGVVIVTGDLNDDDQVDVVVCANKYDNDRGRVYLYYGGNPMDTTFDLTLDGENTKDYFGRKAAIGGDVNGDGYPDLILGARRYPRDKLKGRAYLFYGGNSIDNICDKTFTGESDGDQFGEGVAIFDVDNDGCADVIIGARGWNGGQGRAYLYWGTQDMDVKADKIFMAEPGSSVQTLGQFIWGGYINADPFGDILIGACDYRSYGKGRAFLYYGNTKALMDESADRILTEESTGSCYGNRVTLGDLNNDRYDDVIISGYNYNGGQGRVWIYFNKPPKSK